MSEKKMIPYSDQELDYFRALILEKKAEAEREIEMLKGQISQDNRGELDNDSGYSFHIADSAAVATGRENIYIMIDRQQKLISYLDRALARIEQKTYGICRVTGKKIPKERLEAIPHTELSVEGKIEEQRGRRR
ncbi:TraR/DksA C4-type zinc finger protein [candidate division KSB1 bacterium]|nr:TraR/DksA C4-type zinc finger protein [candidate division KSB1 bacterium]